MQICEVYKLVEKTRISSPLGNKKNSKNKNGIKNVHEVRNSCFVGANILVRWLLFDID
jgi:hypothetical protein